MAYTVLLIAVMHGHVKALCLLGLCYYNGLSVRKNSFTAVDYYQQGAEKGDSEALYCLGYCYQYGSGVVQDVTKATHYYHQAAQKGHIGASHRLQWCSKFGFELKTLDTVKYETIMINHLIGSDLCFFCNNDIGENLDYASMTLCCPQHVFHLSCYQNQEKPACPGCKTINPPLFTQ